MTISALPHRMGRQTSIPLALAARKSAMKNFISLDAHNPLISHDSDERIQGNPRESNSGFPGSFAAKQPVSRKPKRSG
jgi:hypothetical protein